jgi:acetoin utilization deacetylase AcuC-like enzyme
MGAGYTIINDLAVAANYLTSPTLSPQLDSIQKVLVIDCDVHQGDGTAKFEALHNQDRLVSLSLHCASNYPRPKAHSTIDVGLLDNLQDDEYMNILETTVNQAIVDHNPDFVLYDAGVDIYEHDKLGRLKVTEDGIRRRDRFVVETCVQANIPIAAVIGGGYDRDVVALARRHAIVHEECAYVWRKYQLWKRAWDNGTSNNDRRSRGDKS